MEGTEDKKTLVKHGRKILGFVYSDETGQAWHAFGSPRRDDTMSFACRSIESGIAAIECYRPMGNTHLIR